MPEHDVVNSPRHYTTHPRFTCECIEIARLLAFDPGNALKYLWRHEQKNGGEDVRKSSWYLADLEDAQFPVVWISDAARAIGIALAEEHVFPYLDLEDSLDRDVFDLLSRENN